jgi:hypothetical protein
MKNSKTKEKNNKVVTTSESIKDKMKKFFNNPLPMLIALTVIIAILLIYICSINRTSKIYVGEINQSDVVVANIHYFANNQMNYFYASNAVYVGDDVDVYNYQIGYFAIGSDGTRYELASRSGSLDEASPLSELVSELSGWNVGELPSQAYFFDSDVLHNLDNLHFIIMATTEADATTPDIVIDYEVEFTKLSR